MEVLPIGLTPNAPWVVWRQASKDPRPTRCCILRSQPDRQYGGFEPIHVLVRNCRHHGRLIRAHEPQSGSCAPSDCDEGAPGFKMWMRTSRTA